MGVRLAYLGPAGSYSEVAAASWDPTARLVPFPSIPQAIAAIGDAADRAVVPVENSIEGGVNLTLDALAHDERLKIAGEIVLDIDQAFMVAPGTDPATVKVVYSHPQSLGQCQGYLRREHATARQVASLSNSAAVQTMLLSEDDPAGAIGPVRAADLYGAVVVSERIQDVANNQTRFLVLATDDQPPSGTDKTSIIFATHEDQPGTLVSVLSEFAYRGINLTRIESRPTREGLGKYVMFVDLEGHRNDAGVASAFEALLPKVTLLKILGSYPRVT